MSMTTRIALDAKDYIAPMRELIKVMGTYNEETERADRLTGRFAELQNQHGTKRQSGVWAGALQDLRAVNKQLDTYIANWKHVQQTKLVMPSITPQQMKALGIPKNQTAPLLALMEQQQEQFAQLFANPKFQAELSLDRLLHRVKEARKDFQLELKGFLADNKAVVGRDSNLQLILERVRGDLKDQAAAARALAKAKTPEARAAAQERLVEATTEVDAGYTALQESAKKAALKQARAAIRNTLGGLRLPEDQMPLEQARQAARLERDLAASFAARGNLDPREEIKKILGGTTKEWLALDRKAPEISALLEEWLRNFGGTVEAQKRYTQALAVLEQHVKALPAAQQAAATSVMNKVSTAYAKSNTPLTMEQVLEAAKTGDTTTLLGLAQSAPQLAQTLPQLMRTLHTPDQPVTPGSLDLRKQMNEYALGRLPGGLEAHLTEGELTRLHILVEGMAGAYEKTGKAAADWHAIRERIANGNQQDIRDMPQYAKAANMLDRELERLNKTAAQRQRQGAHASSPEEATRRLADLRGDDDRSFEYLTYGRNLRSASGVKQLDLTVANQRMQEAYARTNLEVRDYVKNIHLIQRGHKQLSQQYPDLTRQVRNFQAALSKVDPHNMMDAMLSGHNMSRLVLARVVTMAFYNMTYAARMTTQQMIELSERMEEIRTISQDMPRATASWQSGLFEVSNRTGYGVIDVAGAAYETLSNQIGNSSTVLPFLEELGGFAKTTRSTLEGSMNLVSAVMNAFGKTTAHTDDILAQLFVTIDKGRVRAEDMANTFGRVAAVAPTAGVGLSELLTMIAQLTIAGVKFERSSTYIINLLNKISKPTPALQASFQRWGASGPDQALRQFGVFGILRRMYEDSPASLAQLGVEQRDIRAMQARGLLTRQGTADLQRVLGEIEHSAEAYNNAVGMVMSGSGAIITRETNKLLNVFNESTLKLVDMAAAADRLINTQFSGQAYDPKDGVHLSDVVKTLVEQFGVVALTVLLSRGAMRGAGYNAESRRQARETLAAQRAQNPRPMDSTIAAVLGSSVMQAFLLRLGAMSMTKVGGAAAIGYMAYKTPTWANSNAVWRAQRGIEQNPAAGMDAYTDALKRAKTETQNLIREQENLTRNLVKLTSQAWSETLKHLEDHQKRVRNQFAETFRELERQGRSYLTHVQQAREAQLSTIKAQQGMEAALATDRMSKLYAQARAAEAFARQSQIETEGGRYELANTYSGEYYRGVEQIRSGFHEMLQTLNEAMRLRAEANGDPNLLNQAWQRVQSLGIQQWDESIPQRVYAEYLAFEEWARQGANSFVGDLTGDPTLDAQRLDEEMRLVETELTLLSEIQQALKDGNANGLSIANMLLDIKNTWPEQQQELFDKLLTANEQLGPTLNAYFEARDRVSAAKRNEETDQVALTAADASTAAFGNVVAKDIPALLKLAPKIIAEERVAGRTEDTEKLEAQYRFLQREYTRLSENDQFRPGDPATEKFFKNVEQFAANLGTLQAKTINRVEGVDEGFFTRTWRLLSGADAITRIEAAGEQLNAFYLSLAALTEAADEAAKAQKAAIAITQTQQPPPPLSNSAVEALLSDREPATAELRARAAAELQAGTVPVEVLRKFNLQSPDQQEALLSTLNNAQNTASRAEATWASEYNVPRPAAQPVVQENNTLNQEITISVYGSESGGDPREIAAAVARKLNQEAARKQSVRGTIRLNGTELFR